MLVAAGESIGLGRSVSGGSRGVAHVGDRNAFHLADVKSSAQFAVGDLSSVGQGEVEQDAWLAGAWTETDELDNVQPDAAKSVG
jgi:hypothetical protein